MILADTSVWVDHLRRNDAELSAKLDANEVVIHPFVLGELALGRIPERQRMIRNLARLPQALVATDREVMGLIERRSLVGLGLGYIDVHLLAAVLLTSGCRLWTLDRRLAAAAEAAGVGYTPPR